MKQFLLPCLLLFSFMAKAQSEAVNTSDTTRAILTVQDYKEPPYKPLAVFSSPTGSVSIERGTAIGFNMIPEPQSWLSGYGMLLNFDKATGTINLAKKSNLSGNNYLVNKNILRYSEIGNNAALELARDIPNASIHVADQMYSKQSGNLNLLPLGAIKIEVTGFTNSSGNATVSNVASNSSLYSGIKYLTVHDGIGKNGIMMLMIDLDNITKSYNEIIPIGNMGVDNEGEELQSNFTRILKRPTGQRDVLQVYVSTSNLSSGSKIFGTILIYGLK